MGGRPPLDIDPELVKKLASIHCTMKEIASVLGCSVDTLERRFADIIDASRDNGKMSLKRVQMDMALKGNVPLLIWLGKQHLGQSDKNTIEVSKIPDEVLVEEAKRRLGHDSSGNT